MGPLSIGGLLIEVIAEAIGESGESSTKHGLKRLHSIVQQDDVIAGNSALTEVTQILHISYYKGLVFVIDDCIKILHDLLQQDVDSEDIKKNYDYNLDLDSKASILGKDISFLKEKRKEFQEQVNRLRPKPILNRLASLTLSKIRKESKDKRDPEIEISNTLKEVDLHPMLLSSKFGQLGEEVDFENDTPRLADRILQDFPDDSLSKKILFSLLIHDKKLALYGSSLFSYQLKNNPPLMNVLQSHILMGLMTDVSEIKTLLSKKPAREDISVVTDYQANLSKKYGGKSIHKYDVYALPLTLIPGDFKFHGQSTLAYLPERCIAIHGRPACGITTLLKRIMASTTVESFYIPIEIPLSERVDLLTVKEIIKRLLKIVTDETFELIEKSGRLCILFDGLNEVRDIYGISRQLSFLPEQLENSRFIVTSRSHELKNEAGLDNYKFYEIQPLSLDDQIEFIGTRIDDNITRAKLVEMFTERKHLRSICSNQLIFLMSMRLLGTDRIDTEKISEFYSKFLNWFLLGWEKRKDIGRMQQIMEKIAYEIVKSSSSKTYLDEVAVDQLWNSDPAICTKEEFNFLLRSGFIEYYRHGYRMFQETFQDYLLACWLIRNGVFPIHFEETTPGKWIYKDEFEITELVLKFYLELSGISNFGAGFEAAVSQSTGL